SQLNAENINVKSSDGIVTLEGKVYSYWEKSIAEAIANSSVGVMGVNNNLTVLPRKSFIDVDIENDIKRELEKNPLIDESKLNVSVSNGIVTLSGHVRYRVIKQQVIDIVTYSAGVIDLVDELTIG
ncbi:MAG TPA: BON domain-containing protein, partial [Bacteroidales bacterium]|nr:BON domain-containing protein [Bacteroidales bacterium]